MIWAHFHKGRTGTSPSISSNTPPNRDFHAERRRRRASTAALVAALAIAVLAGCANPNLIGVQDMGSITGRVIDSKTQRPVANALLSIGNVVVQSDNEGVFNFGPPNGAARSAVPLGQQTINVYANGYDAVRVTVDLVTKGTTVNAGLIRLNSVNP